MQMAQKTKLAQNRKYPQKPQHHHHQKKKNQKSRRKRWWLLLLRRTQWVKIWMSVLWRPWNWRRMKERDWNRDRPRIGDSPAMDLGSLTVVIRTTTTTTTTTGTTTTGTTPRKRIRTHRLQRR